MAAAIRHRGPDDEGLWLDPDLPLLLGQRRLAIIDLTPEGHQPMESFSGRYVMTYNGEIYNFQDMRVELEAAHVPFHGRSDTEVMLAAIDHWGLNQALQKIGGMFAFVLWDRQERQLHFVRDRLGKKPLYVGWAGKALVFGSELKALRAHPDFDAEIDRDALALYMRYGCMQPPRSIYKGVWQLPAGHRMTLNLQDVQAGADLVPQMAPYWQLPRVIEEAKLKPAPQSDAQALAEFEALLEDAVKRRMVADVPLGAFLSGGIDSSAVVALMQKQSDRPVQSFSIGFEQAGFDEAPFAARVAAHLGTEHHELYVSAQDALDVIPLLPAMYDEPFADVSQIPTYLVSKFARQHVSVALSGDGGDELLGGYNRHINLPRIWRKIGWMPHFAKAALRRVIESRSAEGWDKILRRPPQIGTKLHKMAGALAFDNIEDSYIDLMSQWKAPGSLVLGAHEPQTFLQDTAWQTQGLSPAEQMMAGDALTYLPNDVLVKVDRASMAVALEARAPLLDYRLFEYAWRLPEHMKIRNGQGKWLLRQVLHKYVPAQLFERPKQGFAVPVGDWLRGPLKDWAEDLLSEDRLKAQGYFDAAQIRASWDLHQNGKGNEAHRLWTALMFQSWLEQK